MKKEHCTLITHFLQLELINCLIWLKKIVLKLQNYQKNLETCLKVVLLEVGLQVSRNQLNFKNRDCLIYKMKEYIADLFPRAGITQYQKLGDLKIIIIVSQFQRLGVKIKVSLGFITSEGHGGESVLCLSPNFQWVYSNICHPLACRCIT